MGLVEVDRHDDGVMVATLNDPDRRNAMTAAMGRAMAAAFADLAAEAELRCLVVTGAPPAFSAGGDLDMLEDHARRTREEGFDATESMREFYGLFLSVRELGVPVVAAVNGHAIGAGLCVALACDLTIVADEARVGLNFARLGLHPGMGGTWLLPRRVGRQRAAELLYTGRLVSGPDAADYGLALESRPAEEVLSRALELAGEVAASAPQVVRQLKGSLGVTFANDLDEQLALEAAHQAANYRTDDVLEGLAAVRERRAPHFEGR